VGWLLPVSLVGSVSGSGGWWFEEADQLTDGVVAVLWMAEWELVVDFVVARGLRHRTAPLTRHGSPSSA